jgi:hypothetical protein
MRTYAYPYKTAYQLCADENFSPPYKKARRFCADEDICTPFGVINTSFIKLRRRLLWLMKHKISFIVEMLKN